MWDTADISIWVEKIRPWPWRKMAVVTTVTFLLASAMSTVIGYMLMGHTTMTKSDASGDHVDASWGRGATLTKSEVDKILERNIFNSEGQTGDVDPTAQANGVQAQKTQLPVKVIGIIYGGSPTAGLAMIENTQKRTVSSFLVGDILAPEATVFEIHADQILIDNQGRREFAMLEEPELRRSTRKGKPKAKTDGPISLGGSGYAVEPPPDSFKEDGFERKGNAIEMTSQYKSRLLTEDFANVLQDAKASPNLVDGVLRGWKLDRIRKNSIYEKFGMQNGDIVEEINGVVLSDASQAVKTLNSLRNEPDLEFKITRNGQKLTLSAKVR